MYKLGKFFQSFPCEQKSEKQTIFCPKVELLYSMLIHDLKFGFRMNGKQGNLH